MLNLINNIPRVGSLYKRNLKRNVKTYKLNLEGRRNNHVILTIIKKCPTLKRNKNIILRVFYHVERPTIEYKGM
jgi:hypothetical protein